MNNQKITKWPSYINPENGEELSQEINLNNQTYLRSIDDTKYPVIKGIPRILENFDNYSLAFGEQWLRWRKTQLDSYSLTTITSDRLLRCLGNQIIGKLNNSKDPIHVLEIGCGAGRFSEILLNFPSVRLTSIDISKAVEANSLNFPQNNWHRVIQADVMWLPFKVQQYDIVIGLGVIQHTPNPEKTIEKLYEQVKPGCDLVIDHYTFEIKRLTKITSNLLRPIIKRLPTKMRMNVIERLVDIFYPIHRVIKNIPFLQKIFSRISPIITYFSVYPQLSDHLQKEWSILDTHDGLTDWYKHLRSLKQINTTLLNLGVKNINIRKGGNGIEARGKRPL